MSPAVSGGGYHHAQRGGKLAASKEGFERRHSLHGKAKVRAGGGRGGRQSRSAYDMFKRSDTASATTHGSKHRVRSLGASDHPHPPPPTPQPRVIRYSPPPQPQLRPRLTSASLPA